jgi:hypothetical protein
LTFEGPLFLSAQPGIFPNQRFTMKDMKKAGHRSARMNTDGKAQRGKAKLGKSRERLFFGYFLCGGQRKYLVSHCVWPPRFFVKLSMLFRRIS